MNDAVNEMKAAAESVKDITPVEAMKLTMWTRTILAEVVGHPHKDTCFDKIAVDFPISLGAAAVAALAASTEYDAQPKVLSQVTAVSDRIQKHLAEIEAGVEGNIIGFELSRIQGAIIGIALNDGLGNIIDRKIDEALSR